VGTPVASNVIDATCFGTASGSVNLDVPGETGNLLEWSLDGITWTSFTAGNQVYGIPAGAAPTFQRVLSVRRNSTDPCFAAVTITIKNAVADITTSFTSTDASCSNNDGAIQVSPVSGGTAPYTYRLDSIDYASLPANNTFTGLAGGPHKFTVIDAIGCTKYFKATINFPGLVNFTQPVSNPPSCGGNGNDGIVSFIITSSGTFDVGYTSDQFNDPATFISVVSDGNTIITFNGLGGLPQGSYYYVVAKPVGALCPSRSLPISMLGPAAVDFSAIPQDFVCLDPNGPNGIIKVAGIKGSSLVDYNYQIFSAGNSNPIQSGTITQFQALPPDTISFIGLKKGKYQMILTQDQSTAANPGCTISSTYKSFSINGPTLTSFDTVSVTRKASERVQSSGSIAVVLQNTFAPEYLFNLKLLQADFPHQDNKHNAFDSTWVQFDTSDSIKFQGLYAGTYKLSMIDTFGCQRIDTLKISVRTDIFIPNVFTPNNDGKNDNFEIINLPDNSSIVITNRWGRQVFSGSKFAKISDPAGITSSSIVWDGGSEVDGIYYYNLVAGGKMYTGWIEILHPSH
jgi:gliding motility-associated-like protein